MGRYSAGQQHVKQHTNMSHAAHHEGYENCTFLQRHAWTLKASLCAVTQPHHAT